MPKQTSSRIVLSAICNGGQYSGQDHERGTHPVHFVGDVPQHDRGADIAAIENALATDTVMLISWVSLVRAVVRGSGRTVSNKATLIVNTRLGAMRGVHSSLARPRRSLGDSPTEGVL